jgi:N-acetylglucosamine-6-sulfatase
LRSLLIACIALLATPLAARAADVRPTTRPNIIFVITDDQRWDAMGCAGHPFLKTPNMDRIAREGAMFTNSFVTTPLCSPARSSFLTGQYVHRTGVVGNGPAMNAISHQLVTFPRLLHDAGYESAYVGKWHMGNDDAPRPGFDRWVSFKGQGVYCRSRAQHRRQAGDEDRLHHRLVTDYALDFINREHAKPFVLYLGHKAVHGPFKPADRHATLYQTEPLPRRPNMTDDLPASRSSRAR